MKLRFDSSVLCKLEPAHLMRLEEWVKRVWSDAPETWETFLRKLPGFYPLDVLHSLSKSGLNSDRFQKTAAAIARHMFPEPFPDTLEHPLDYEWRFTQESIHIILDKVRGHVRDTTPPSVVCLGCPSIVVAGEHSEPSWNWTLLDRRSSLLRSRVTSARLVSCDLTRETPNLPTQDIAIVDPPWYTPITKHFLVRANSLIKHGGIVLLSFPPEGTRPGAKRELAELLKWCDEGGLESTQTEATAIYYRTPFFECNSLNAAGFSARVPAWRRADLLAFRKRAASPVKLRYDEEVPQHFSAKWREFALCGLKVCVKVDDVRYLTQAGETIEELWPVWSEQILPTVSTKFPGRDQANIVTAGNRFLRCTRPEVIAGILEAWTRDPKLMDRPSNTKHQRLSENMAAVMKREIVEKELYLKQIYD